MDQLAAGHGRQRRGAALPVGWQPEAPADVVRPPGAEGRGGREVGGAGRRGPEDQVALLGGHGAVHLRLQELGGGGQGADVRLPDEGGWIRRWLGTAAILKVFCSLF